MLFDFPLFASFLRCSAQPTQPIRSGVFEIGYNPALFHFVHLKEVVSLLLFITLH